MVDIQKTVKNLVRKYDSKNPFELCNAIGILVKYKNFNKVIRGIYQYDCNIRIINLNNNLNYHLKKQVCAHELGHAILHKRINTCFLDKCTYLLTNKIEFEANTFAAELLISDEEIYTYQGCSKLMMASCLEVEENIIDCKLKLMNKIKNI